MQGKHQLTTRLLAQRILRDQGLELREKPQVLTECELGLQALLHRGLMELPKAL
jgi:hypothetical protein